MYSSYTCKSPVCHEKINQQVNHFLLSATPNASSIDENASTNIKRWPYINHLMQVQHYASRIKPVEN